MIYDKLKDVEGYPQDKDRCKNCVSGAACYECTTVDEDDGFNDANAQHKTFLESVEVDEESIIQSIAHIVSPVLAKEIATAIAEGLRYRRKG